MDMRYRLALIAALGIAVIVGVYVGRSQPQSSASVIPTSLPTPLPTPALGQVNIVPSSAGSPPATYQPAVLRARVGEPITWVNRTDIDHNVTADDGFFNSDVLSPGQSFRWTPTRAGTYPYGDFLFPEMRGEIDISP